MKDYTVEHEEEHRIVKGKGYSPLDQSIKTDFECETLMLMRSYQRVASGEDIPLHPMLCADHGLGGYLSRVNIHFR